MSAKLNLMDNDQGLVEAALEIAARRNNTLRQLRDALVRGDDVKALSLARKVCGLKDEKVHRAFKSLNGGAGSRR